MLDLVISQVMVVILIAASSGAVHRPSALTQCSVYFPHCVCTILFPEMSVDSDRDSVIESEDDKEAVVRPFFLLFHRVYQGF